MPMAESVVVLLAKNCDSGASELLSRRRTAPPALSTTLALMVSWRPAAALAV